MSGGNRLRGRKKSVAALKAYGQRPKAKKYGRPVRVSVASEGFGSNRERLISMVRGLASCESVSNYARSVTRKR